MAVPACFLKKLYGVCMAEPVDHKNGIRFANNPRVSLAWPSLWFTSKPAGSVDIIVAVYGCNCLAFNKLWRRSQKGSSLISRVF